MLNFIKLLVIVLVIYPSLLLATCGRDWWNPLAYQTRGDRCEGIIPRPANNRDIELISALIDVRETLTNRPENYKLKFYLPNVEKIHIKVQELEPKHYYRLDTRVVHK